MSEGPYSIEAAMFDSTMQLHWFAVIVEGSKVGCVCEVTTEGEATKCCDELNRLAGQRDKLLAVCKAAAVVLSVSPCYDNPGHTLCLKCAAERACESAIADVEKQQ